MVGHFTEFEDEYLESLFEFHEADPDARVRTGQLADHLDLSPQSVTEMLQRLDRRGLVELVPYRGARLTEAGLLHGRRIKRRHRLAEVLLDRMPTFQGDIHETACRLEHAINDDLEDALSALLGHPTKDPSGRAIPPSERELDVTGPTYIDLTEVVDSRVVVRLVLLHPEVAKGLRDLGLQSGTSLEGRDDGWFLGDRLLELDEAVARSILVECLD